MKKLLTLATASALIFSSVASAENAVSIFIKGEKLTFNEGTPFIQNDRTLVPTSTFLSSINTTSMYDEETRTTTALTNDGSNIIVLQDDCDKLFVNNDIVSLDVTPTLLDGVGYVPIRAISEALSYIVSWDGDTNSVYIDLGDVTDTGEDVSEVEQITDVNEAAEIATDDDSTSTQIANPWVELSSVDELNEKLNEYEGEKFFVADISDKIKNITEVAYRYNSNNNLAEVIYTKEDGSEITIRTALGDYDISGIYGGEITDTQLLYDISVDFGKLDNITYATWAEEIPLRSFSVAISNSTESKVDINEIVGYVIKLYPKGW